jgi:uncharacterized repeat protein (TIGR01451 family)
MRASLFAPIKLIFFLIFIIILILIFVTFDTIPLKAMNPFHWVATSSLITPTGYHEAVIYQDEIYVIGGATLGLITSNAIYSATILPLGRLEETWKSVISLNLTPVQDAASLVSQYGWIYIIGGFNGQNRLSSTFYGRPNLDGAIEWKTSAFQLLPTRNLLSSVIIGDYIYVTGGCKEPETGNVTTNEVRYSKVSQQGELLQPWNLATHYLNKGRCAHASVAFDKWIYVLGGTVEDLSETGSVEFAQVNNGIVGPWEYTSSLPPLSDLAAVVTKNGIIFAIGGQNRNDVSNKVYSATINLETGHLSPWEDLSDNEGLVLPRKLHSHTALLADNGSIYLTGGQANPFGSQPEFLRDVYYLAPIITLTKTSDPPGPVHEGDIITYTIAYANTSLTTQTMTLTDVLPFNVTLIPSTISPTAELNGSTLVWKLGNKLPGEAGQVSFQVQVPLLPSLSQPSISALSAPPPMQPPAYVLPVPVACDTTRFWANGVTAQPEPTSPYTLQVQIPPGAKPSEMWLLMKGINHIPPTVGGQPALQVVTSTKSFSASLWSASITPTGTTGDQVTVITHNPRELNALFLFDKNDPPFEKRTLEDFFDTVSTGQPKVFTYTFDLPSVATQTIDMIMPFMDITYLTDNKPIQVDTRLTTATMEFADQPRTVVVNDPNLGNGLMMTQFLFDIGPLTDRVTTTEILTVTVDTQDSVYTLAPRVCRPVYIENTAWLCSDQAGCISATATNIPDNFRPPSIYLPIILKSYP